MKKKVNLTSEETEKLKPILGKLGLEITVMYETACNLCGKKFRSKDEKQVSKRLEKHVDEKCNAAKWLRGTAEILKLLGLKKVVYGDLVYIQDGKFPIGYSHMGLEELGILDRARDLINFREGTSNE